MGDPLYLIFPSDWNDMIFRDIVKSFMKNRSITYGKIRKTLPLEGGGRRVGVKK